MAQKHINNHVFTIHPDDESASEDFGILANPDTYVRFATGSCNGIVCYYDKTTSIYLSNPATREFKQLPPTSFEQGTTDEKFYQFGIAFGSGSTNIYDFKVCRMFIALKEGYSKPTHKAFRAEMFTLSSNSWKQLQWGLDDRVHFVNRSVGSFCCNSFHFLAQRSKSHVRTIVCCDIHTERFRTMELPSSGDGLFVYLMAHPDYLSVFCNKHPKFSSHPAMEVWIMKDYGVVASWTKLYSIGHGQYGVPQFFWTEKDVLVTELETSGLFLCHHDTLNCEPLEIDGYDKLSQFLVYQETLVSIM